MHRDPQPVSPADLEARLSALQELPGSQLEGFFGPGSLAWHVNRESAVFLGAGRAALLQLAHPWVGAALQQHSTLMHDAIARFHSTFRVIYTMLFGSRAQALAVARQLYGVHTAIQGTVGAAGGPAQARDHYQANEVAALRWVFATLVESAVLAYELALPSLSEDQRSAFYLESKRIGALCGIPPDALPPSWRALTFYTEEMAASSTLRVEADARRMGQAVLSGVGTWVRAPHWYRALTACWLPPALRAGFDLPYGAAEERAVQRARRWIPRIYPCVPRFVRWVGPFHEARNRLAGELPGQFTQASNRFWMGRSRLLYARGSTAP